MNRSEDDPRARLGFPEDEHVTKMPRYPSCYQVNTRVWLMEISHKLGRTATLDDIPDTELECLKESGFDWMWFLSVWQTGAAGQRVLRANPQWRREFQRTLADLQKKTSLVPVLPSPPTKRLEI